MLTGAVTNLRGLALLRLGETCQIGASTFTDDGGGGGSASWSFGSDTPCRVDPLTGRESELADRVSDRSTHLITLPPETAVTVASQIQTAAATYEVTAVRSRTGEQARFVEAVEVT